jgi:vacuolar-type H+-ATPase subunit I/STV1
VLSAVSSSLERFRDAACLVSVFALVPVAQWAQFALPVSSSGMVLVKLGVEGKRVVVGGFAPTRDRSVLDRTVRSLGAELLELPDDMDGIPAQLADRLERDLTTARAEESAAEEERAELALEWGERLQRRRALLSRAGQTLETISKFRFEQTECFATGTVDEERLEALRGALESETQEPHWLLAVPSGKAG